MRIFIFALLFATGCVARQELREQQCAQLALAQHGAHKPLGVYGTWVSHGNQCWSHLWDGERLYEGRLDDKWRPE